MNDASKAKDSSPAQYLKASLLFASELIKIGEAAGSEGVAVSELVKVDQLLLQFNPPDDTELEEFIKQPISLGANCYFSADNNQVFAGVTGYPKILHQPISGKDTTILHIAVEPLFRISVDQMKAAIAIHPPTSEGKSLIDFDLDLLMEEEGIVHGIDSTMVKKAKDSIRAKLPEFNVMMLARGNKAHHGKDAFLEFEVKTGPIPGKILEDGTIDFRERMIFVPVSKDQVIAKKIPPTHGTAGKTIRGQRVEPQPGNDISVNTLKDATYSSKNRTVTATANGVLSVVGDTIIKVCSRQEIMGDIDYSTGHIASRNCVLIHGSVQPGFKVTTDGDLEIRGTIMSTKISCQSNLIIKGGVLGRNSKVSSLGDADVYFIEQGEIECGRNCIIRKESYYSTIVAKKNILCVPNSAVVGGRLIAAGNLALGSAGSPNSAPAFLAAGVDGKRLNEYNQLQKSMLEQQEALIRLLQLRKGLIHQRKIKKMEQSIEETRQKLTKINLIPGTDHFSRPDESEELSDSTAILIQDISIEIHGIVHAGTVIQIGNRSMTLTNTISNRLFKLNDTFTEISALPLRKR